MKGGEFKYLRVNRTEAEDGEDLERNEWRYFFYCFFLFGEGSIGDEV